MSRKFIYLFVLVIVPLMGTVSLNPNEPQPPKLGKSYALFFAVDTYNDRGWKNLKNPIRDAKAIAKELKEVYNFDTQIIQNPSRRQVLNTLLQWQKKRFNPDDQLFVFFSGHGSFSDAFTQGFFIPSDGKEDDQLHESHLELTQIGNIVTNIPCKHILLAIDACYSGTIDRAIAFKGTKAFSRPVPTQNYDPRQSVIDLQLRNKTRRLLTSGGKERTPDGSTHSPFAGTIITALREAYTTRDGMLTYKDLEALMERVNPLPHYGELPGHEGGGFVFVGPRMQATSPKPRPVSTTPAAPIRRNDLPDPPMSYVEGGTFQMGCTSEQQDCDSDETAHSATVSSFYMGKYEVTFEEFDEFCTATQREKPSDSKWGRNKRPVINVDWYDALEYCNWLSSKIGYTPVYTIDKSSTDPNNSNSYDKKKWTVTANWQANGFRLPTEAEWEYAARQKGQKVLFGNGKNVLDPAEVNFDASSNYKKSYSKAGVYRQKTVPVGSLNSPSSLDLNDMSGNVWEWCWDWKGDYLTNPPKDYKGPKSGARRVYRGGSWNGVPQGCRVANRYDLAPSYRLNYLGFRLARNG